MKNEKSLILSNHQVQQKINRIAYQIYEHYYKEEEIVIAGIAAKGYDIAKLLAKKLEAISPLKIHLVKVELNKEKPLKNAPNIDIDEKLIHNKSVVLVDDVLNSGKTLIYGVKHFLNYPLKRLSTAVLIDRNHKKYPIGIHFNGMSLSTTLKDNVSVEINKNKIEVYLT
jgi:pyrimidine operon attenuation protein/uracil phosphoribosyltransferase